MKRKRAAPGQAGPKRLDSGVDPLEKQGYKEAPIDEEPAVVPVQSREGETAPPAPPVPETSR